MATSDVLLTQDQFTTLVSLARRNIASSDDLRKLNVFIDSILKKNSIKHFLLWVRWKNAGELLPVTLNFPKVYPPTLEFCLESFERPISRSDVQEMLDKQGKTTIEVIVTTDPAKLVGWTRIDDYFR